MKKVVLLGFLLLSSAAGAVQGVPSTLLGTFGGWKAFTFMDSGNKVCFISSAPKKQEGKFAKRGEVKLFVTRWADGRDKNLVSVSGGYKFKEGSTATMKAGDKFYLFATQNDMGWSKSMDTDDAIVAELQKGGTLVVEGTSVRGTKTTDTYDLTGAADAYKASIEACAKK